MKINISIELNTRKFKRDLKNFILKSITFLSTLAFLFGAMALDSHSNLPYILCVVSFIWLVPFTYVNVIRKEYITW